MDELLKRDLTITININLLDNHVDRLLAKRVRPTKSEHLTDLISCDDARAVFIKHAEGSLQLILRGQLSLLHGSHHELRVVDEATSVCIDCVEHVCDFLIGHHLAVVLQISFFDLLNTQLAIAIFIKRFEHLGQIVSFLLAKQL